MKGHEFHSAMFRKAVLIALWLCILGGKTAWGQATCTRLKNSEGNDRLVHVVVEGTKAWKSGGISASVQPAWQYGDGYFVGAEQVVARREGMLTQLLLCDESDKSIGWVDKNAVLENLEALKTPEGIHKKALVVRRIKLGKSNETKEIHTLRGPGSRYSKHLTVPFFQFFYVFKIQQNEGKKHYLLGLETNIRIEGKAKETLIGWLPQENLQEWNRLSQSGYSGGQWAERMKGSVLADKLDRKALFFETKEQALQGAPATHTGREDESRKPWNKERLRLPLLSVISPSGENVEKRVRIHPNKKCALVGGRTSLAEQRVFQFGVLGAVRMGLDNVDHLEKLASLENLDVLFLVDATGNMQKYYPRVKKTIKQVVAALQHRGQVLGAKNRERNFTFNLRLGVAFYRDIVDGVGIYEVKQNAKGKDVPLMETKDLPEIQRQLDTVRVDGGGDIPEAITYALKRAVEKTNWRDDSHRMIVLLGNAPSHIGTTRQGLKDPTLQEVAATMKKHGTMFYALQGGAPQPNGTTHFSPRFEEQFGEKAGGLLHLLRSDPNYSPLAAGYSKVPYVGGSKIDGIWKAFEAAQKTILDGKSEIIVRAFRPRKMIQFHEDLLGRMGLRGKDYKNKMYWRELWSTECHPVTGFVQLRSVVLLEQEQAQALYVLLRKMAELLSAGRRVSYNELRSRYMGLLEHITRSPILTTSLHTVGLQKLGIPLHTDMLRLNFSQLLHLLEEPQKRRALLQQVLYRRQLLGGVIRSCDYKERVYDPETKQTKEVLRKGKSWFFRRTNLSAGLRTDAYYAWVPLEFLP